MSSVVTTLPWTQDEKSSVDLEIADITQPTASTGALMWLLVADFANPVCGLLAKVVLMALTAFMGPP